MIKSAWKKAVRVVRDADIYGQPISLSYNRYNKFKTKLGGFSTIVLGGFMAAYFSFLLYGLFARSTLNYSTTTIVRDITQNPKMLDIAKNGFKIMIGLGANSPSLFDDDVKKYIELVVTEREFFEDPGVTYQINIKNLNLEEWGDNFPYHDKSLVKYYGLDRYICVTNDDYQLAGDVYSDYLKNVRIEIKRCNNSTYSTWETSENIEDFISKTQVQIIFVDHFFDLQSFDDPIKPYITQKYYYSLSNLFERTAQVFIRENNLELMDSVFQYQSYDKRKFYSIDQEKLDFRTLQDVYLKMFIYADATEVTHRRTVFSLFDMVAQIGGVYNVLSSISLLVFRFYAQKMMQYWVLRKNYQFDSREDNKMPVYTEDDKKRMLQNNSDGSASSPQETHLLQSRRESFRSPSALHLNLRKSLLKNNTTDPAEKEDTHF